MEKIKQMIEDAKSSKQNEEILRKAIVNKLCYIETQLGVLLSSNMGDNVSTMASDSFSEIIEQVRYASQTCLEMFRHDDILPKLKAYLRTSVYAANKKIIIGRKNLSSKSSTLAANILYRLHYLENFWSFEFLLLYLDDALGARQWVDSDGDSGQFAKNISAVDNIGALKASGLMYGRGSHRSSASPSLQDMNSSDEEDEEILDEGGIDKAMVEAKSPVSALVIPISTQSSVIKYRFSHCRDDVAVLILTILIDRCKSQVSISSLDTLFNAVDYQPQNLGEVDNEVKALLHNIQSSNTWTVIATMITFCEQYPIIRLISSYCLERWISNPAIGDYVRKYLHDIVGVIARTTNANDISSTSNGININEVVIREIVKLRQKMKANQQEYYKASLMELAKINSRIATIILRCMLEEELSTAGSSASSSSSNRGETVKFIVAVLHTVKQNVKVSSGIVGEVFGASVRELYHPYFHPTSTSTSASNALFQTDIDWNQIIIKVVAEIVARVIKGCGVKDFPFDSFTRSYLPSSASREHMITIMTSKAAEFFNHIMFILWSDICSVSQAIIGNELVIIDRQRQQLQSHVNVASSNKRSLNGDTHPTHDTDTSSAIDIIHQPSSSSSNRAASRPAVTPTSSGGLFVASKRSVPMPLGSTSASSTSSTFFRSSAPSTGSAIKSQTKPVISTSMSSATSNTLSLAMPSSTSSSSSTVVCKPELSTQLTEEDIFKSRQHHLYQLLSIHEEFLSFLEVIITLSRQKNFLRHQPTVSLDAEVRTNPDYFWLNSGLGMIIESVSKFSSAADLIDKNAAYRVRDYGCCSHRLMLSLTSIIQQYSSSIHHVYQGISIIESVIERGLKTMFHGFDSSVDMTGNIIFESVLVDDVSIIPQLLSLSMIYPMIPKHDEATLFMPPSVPIPIEVFIHHNSSSNDEYNTWKRRLLSDSSQLSKKKISQYRKPLTLPNLTSSSLSKSKSSNMTEYIPNFVHKKFYWRLCSSLYLLGCARPQTIGRYLWDNLPSVQTLLLMSMTSRYYYPPTVVSMDDRLGASVGSKLPIISTSSGSFYPKNRLQDKNMAMSIYHHSNSIELLVTPYTIELSKGRLQDVSNAISDLQDNIAGYYFQTYHPPIETNTSSVYMNNMNDRMKTREVRRLQEEAEAMEEKRLAQDRKQQAAYQRSLRAANRGLVSAPTLAEQQVANILSDFAFLVSNTDVIPAVMKRTRDDISDDSSRSSSTQPKKRKIKVSEVEAEFDESTGVTSIEQTTTNHTSKQDSSNIKLSELVIPASSTLYELMPYHNQYNESIDINDLILCNLGMSMSPIPSDDTIQSIKNYDIKYSLGNRLRGCEDPDFIASAVIGHQSSDNNKSSISSSTSSSISHTVDEDDRIKIEQALGWLIPAITVDMDRTLKRLPINASAYILMMLSSKIYKRYSDYLIWKLSISSKSSDIESTSTSTSIYATRSTTSLFQYLSSQQEHHADVTLLVALLRIVSSSLSSEESSYHRAEVISTILKDITSSYVERRNGAIMVLAYLQNITTMSDAGISCMQSSLRQGPYRCDYITFLLRICSYHDGIYHDHQHHDYSQAIIQSIALETNDEILCQTIVQLYEHHSKDLALQVFISILSSSIHRASTIISSLNHTSDDLISSMLQPILDAIIQSTSYHPYISNISASNQSKASSDHTNAFIILSYDSAGSAEYEIRIDIIRALLLVYINVTCSNDKSNSMTDSDTPLDDYLPKIKTILARRGILVSIISASHSGTGRDNLPMNAVIGMKSLYIDIIADLLNSTHADALKILAEVGYEYLDQKTIIHIFLPAIDDKTNAQICHAYGISLQCCKWMLQRLDSWHDSGNILFDIIRLSNHANTMDDTSLIIQSSLRRLKLLVRYLAVTDPGFVSTSATTQSLLNTLEAISSS